MGALLLLLLLLILLLFTEIAHSCSDGECQMQQRCSGDSDCSTGLECRSCVVAGIFLPICVRSDLNMPAMYNLSFSKYAWLTTHNSFAISSESPRFPVPRLAPTNQEDSISSQLQNGVRGFMLDMYDFQDDIWLCHSFEGKCFETTAFMPAIEALTTISSFLEANPNEVVVIFIEDYVKANNISSLIDRALLRKFWFPLSRMPAAGQEWPLLSEMIQLNQRLIVFTSDSTKEQSEGIAYQWTYTAENQYGDDGMKAGECSARAESPPLNSTAVSLIVQNYFRSFAVGEDGIACRDHGDDLLNMLPVCAAAAANRWSNFLAVDFYLRSTGGGAFQAVDTASSKLLGSKLLGST